MASAEEVRGIVERTHGITARARDAEAVKMYKRGYEAGSRDRTREIVDRLRRGIRDGSESPTYDPHLADNMFALANWLEREYLPPDGGEEEYDE